MDTMKELYQYLKRITVNQNISQSGQQIQANDRQEK